MKYLVLIGLLSCCLGGKSIAQYFPSEHWHEGYLVTEEEDTVRGAVKYDMENDIVQVNQNNRLQTFSASNFIYFEIYDLTTENYRKFYSLPYSQLSRGYKVPRIFEVLYIGDLTLMTREAIIKETVPEYQSFRGGYYATRDKLDHNYFFFEKSQSKIIFYSGKKSDLLTIMRPKADQVKEYMKTNKLRHDTLRDLIRITAFYNSI